MLKLIAVLVLFVAVPVLAEDESQAGMIAVGVGNWEPEILSSVVDGKRAYPAISGCFFHLTVDELNTLDYLRDELGALESAPVFLGIGGQFENHGERGYT